MGPSIVTYRMFTIESSHEKRKYQSNSEHVSNPAYPIGVGCGEVVFNLVAAVVYNSNDAFQRVIHEVDKHGPIKENVNLRRVEFHSEVKVWRGEDSCTRTVYERKQLECSKGDTNNEGDEWKIAMLGPFLAPFGGVPPSVKNSYSPAGMPTYGSSSIVRKMPAETMTVILVSSEHSSSTGKDCMRHAWKQTPMFSLQHKIKSSL